MTVDMRTHEFVVTHKSADVARQEVLGTPEKALEAAVYGFHRDFNTTVWPQTNPDAIFSINGQEVIASYHHEGHIIAAREAAKAIFAINRQQPEEDIFDIEQSIQTWNSRHAELQITDTDAEQAMDWMFLLHDLGNIAQDGYLNADGSVNFASFYQGESGPTEERSIQLGIALAKYHLQKDPAVWEKFQRLQPLIEHLARQTNLIIAQQEKKKVEDGELDPAQIDTSFRVAVQGVDQSWSYAFSRDSVTRNSVGFMAEKSNAVAANNESGPPMTQRGSLLFPRISTRFILGALAPGLSPEEQARLKTKEEKIIQSVDSYASDHGYTPLSQRMAVVDRQLERIKGTPQETILTRPTDWKKREEVNEAIQIALELEAEDLKATLSGTSSKTETS